MRFVRALCEGVSATAKGQEQRQRKVSKENVTTAGRRVTQQESAPRPKIEESPNEKEKVTKEKAKVRGAGAKASGV